MNPFPFFLPAMDLIEAQDSSNAGLRGLRGYFLSVSSFFSVDLKNYIVRKRSPASPASPAGIKISRDTFLVWL